MSNACGCRPNSGSSIRTVAGGFGWSRRRGQGDESQRAVRQLAGMKGIIAVLLFPFQFNDFIAVALLGPQLEILKEWRRQADGIDDQIIGVLLFFTKMEQEGRKISSVGRNRSLSRTEPVRRMAAVSLVS